MSIGTPPAWEIALPPSIPLRRFSVDEYHRMLEAGVFADDEPFELLEGWVVPRMTRKPPRDIALALGAEVLRAVLPEGWHIHVQSAITTLDSEPEPDLAVVRGAIRDYTSRHPGPADVALVVEVADASLATARGLKGRIYARAGIPAYWLINLVDRRVEVYNDPSGLESVPSYRELHEHSAGDAVALVIGGEEIARIDPAELLP